MRTYSHTLLTYAASGELKPNEGKFAAWAALGATLPDLPAGIGATWLGARRLYSRETFLREVCGRAIFGKPDAALHSILPVALALGMSISRPGPALPLALGWAGHVAVDTLTHGADARPLLWPISDWRFESPLSYRERERYGRYFTLVEHSLLIAAVVRMLRR
jgi:hypothetical protein